VKKLAIFLLKVFGSGALIGYLVWDAIRNDAFRLLLEQPKDWGLLILGAGFFVASAVACFLRWGFLVRALSIPFSHSEALRLGMIGYLVNLAPMGVVGGDLVKMVLLARLGRSEPEHAVASVLVDRAIGLYMLFVVAGAALLWTGFWRQVSGDFLLLCWAVWAVSLGGLAAALLILLPPAWPRWVTNSVEVLPWVGPPLARLGRAMRQYRAAFPTLLGCVGLTLLMDLAYVTAVYLAARAIFVQVPSWQMHVVVAPLSNSASVIPLPMGPFEFVLDRLYLIVPVAGGGAMQPGQGLMVALVIRLFNIALATAGAIYFLGLQPQLLLLARSAAKGKGPEVAEASRATTGTSEQEPCLDVLRNESPTRERLRVGL
jgi:hypothetical protein